MGEKEAKLKSLRGVDQQEEGSQKPASKQKESDDSKPSFYYKATVPGVEYIDSEVLAPWGQQEQSRAASSYASKASVPSVEYMDRKVLVSSHYKANAMIEYIDGEVLAPREHSDDDDSKKPPSSDDNDDAKAQAGLHAISSTSTDPDGGEATPRRIIPGAVQVMPNSSLKRTSYASHDDDLLEEKSTMDASTSWAQHPAEDPEALMSADGGVTLLQATKVESQWNLVTAVPAEDNCFKSSRGNRKVKLLIIGACLVLVALVVGLTVAFAGGSRDTTIEPKVTQDTFFDMVGLPMDGAEEDGNYGLSVATNREGSRIAISDLFGVDVFEWTDSASDWELLGSNSIEGNATNALSATGDYNSLHIRAPVLTTMSMDGNVVAVGWPLHDIDNGTISIGLVEVYRYVNESWERQGNSLFGEVSGDMFGSSLSLSENGGTLAIGAAGNGGYAMVYVLESDTWNELGEVVLSSEHDLDIYSVSLSNDGGTLAVGGVPSDGATLAVSGVPDIQEGAVAKVFQLVSGEWKKLGSGIGGRQHIGGDTIYLADLSGDGKTIVVSNYYTTEAKENTGEGLDVRAFIWSEDTDNWEQLGQNMHSGNEDEKSGYFVSLSEDGRKIAMGDPGARVQGQGAVSGHAHFFEFKDIEWIQAGPNYEGEAAGDQFGYAVALSGNGDFLVAGAPFNRAAGEERGRVVVLTEA